MDKKTEKKARKLLDQIEAKEIELRLSLQKKVSSQKEVDVSAKRREIDALKAEAAKLLSRK